MLRYYQKESVEKLWLAYKQGRNGLVMLPTGAGKTAVICALTYRAVSQGLRVLILSHRKELLEQTDSSFARFGFSEVKPAVYSAGLGRRELDSNVIIAGIHSIYKKGELLGHIDIVIIDEVHLLPATDNGMYRQLLASLQDVNPLLVVLGLTATPYRLTTGLIYGPSTFFPSLDYEAKVSDLIVQGYLSPLTSVGGLSSSDLQKVNSIGVKNGEFDKQKTKETYAELAFFKKTMQEMWGLCQKYNRRSVLIFASSISHARSIVDWVDERDTVSLVTGETDEGERERKIALFRSSNVRFLVNVDVLTTGFDAPNVDCVVLMRPTKSAGLYCQMVGRGLRRCKGKEGCVVLDFGGNVERFGGIDSILSRVSNRKTKEKGEKDENVRLVRLCPKCHAYNEVGACECIECGFSFKRDNTIQCPHCGAYNSNQRFSCFICNHIFKKVGESTNSRFDVLTGQHKGKVRGTIIAASAKKHVSKTSGKECVCVSYKLDSGATVREYLCPLHSESMRQKALEWLQSKVAYQYGELTLEKTLTYTSAIAANLVGSKLEAEGFNVRFIQYTPLLQQTSFTSQPLLFETPARKVKNRAFFYKTKQ